MTLFSGATFDSRLVKPGMLFIAVKGEKCDGRDFIPKALAAGAAGVIEGYEELAKIARAYRRSLKAKVIGVTGSAGKTTTKELLKAFLSKAGKTYATEGNFNNHLGLPVTILNCPSDADFLVVEMGTNHPGEIAALCDIAEIDGGVLTNVGSAHIEFFGSGEAIAREKGVLIERAKDFAVVSGACAHLDILKAMRPGLETVDPAPGWMKDTLEDVLPGVHNLSNAAIAYAAAARYGVSEEEALGALKGFSLPGSRWRRVEKDGIDFIDDTYNANPEAMMAALATFAGRPAKGRKIAVLGDMFELGGEAEALHRKVFGFAASLDLDLVIAVGETSSKMGAGASFATVEELKASFPSLVRPGDTVLLKASHSMNLGSILSTR